MRFYKTHDPDVLATRYGSKAPNVVFAIFCFAFGSLAMLTGLGVFGWEAEAPPAISFLLGVALCVGGVGFLTYRRGFIVDRRRGLLTQWRSVLGLRWKKAMLLGDLERVSVHCERRKKPDRSASSRYTAYPIWIHGKGEAFKLSDELDRETSRSIAKQAAEVLRIKLVDRSDEIVHKDEWL